VHRGDRGKEGREGGREGGRKGGRGTLKEEGLHEDGDASPPVQVAHVIWAVGGDVGEERDAGPYPLEVVYGEGELEGGREGGRGAPT
jgi:hypothetical protein